jgi:hypothetical protein
MCTISFLSVNQKGRGLLGYVCVDGRIIVKLMYRKWGMKLWTRLMWVSEDSWRDLVNGYKSVASIKD